MLRYWPGPDRAAPRVALVGAVVAGLVAAVTLVLDRPGLGWPLTGAAVALAAAATARRRPTPAELAWSLVALGLLAVGGLRAAGWLFAYCIVGALTAASLALAGGRTVRGLAAGAAAGLLSAGRALPWGVGGVGQALPRRRPGGARIGRALLVTVGLLAVFGGLFGSADPAFAQVMTGWVPPPDGPDLARALFCGVLVTLVTLGTAFLAARRPDFDDIPAATSRPVRRVEWALPLAALDLLFLAFVLVQATELFGGQRGALDYARYTRSGFWQLVAVTVLTMAVLTMAARVAPRQEPADRVLLRVLLGGLSVLALVVVASALRRLALYEEAYGFTRLRVLVGAVELWLGLVFGLVLVAGVRLRAGWLPRAVAGTAAAGLLTVALLNPDRFIADRNVDRYQRTGDIDIAYLASLSADAAPALDRLPVGLRSCALRPVARTLVDEPDDWRTWNLGRSRARTVIATDIATCQRP
jgi:hypothetical protein